jgi:hypothetical protein
MWKHIAEGFAEVVPVEFAVPRLADWPWRKILAEGGILLAFVLTSSLLVRG